MQPLRVGLHVDRLMKGPLWDALEQSGCSRVPAACVKEPQYQSMCYSCRRWVVAMNGIQHAWYGRQGMRMRSCGVAKVTSVPQSHALSRAVATGSTQQLMFLPSWPLPLLLLLLLLMLLMRFDDYHRYRMVITTIATSRKLLRATNPTYYLLTLHTCWICWLLTTNY